MMGYDPLANEVVLFGGYPGQGTTWLGDTWVFSGGTWTQLNLPVHPAARAGGGLAYDPSVKELILFGGVTDTTWFSDTWAFHGNVWTQLNPSVSPPSVYRFGMATDVADSGVLVFGGCAFHLCPIGTTWLFSNGSWTNETKSIGPVGRIDVSMAAGPGGGVLLFGGIRANCSQGRNCAMGDTWSFRGGNWTKLALSLGPPPRSGAMMAACSNGTDLLFGGAFSRHLYSDTWLYRLGKWTNLTSLVGIPPPAQDVATLTWDTYNGVDVLLERFPYNGTWEFTP